MKKEFVMRGQTVSSGTEVLNFSGFKPGMAYRLVEFQVFPSVLGTAAAECFGSISAGKNEANPVSPDFNDEGLIANAMLITVPGATVGVSGPVTSIINDTFLITQNLILSVRDTDGSLPVNWQCKFEGVKMSGSEEAVTNYKQFLISDE